MKIATLLWESQRHATRESDVALMVLQILTRNANSRQRRRAGRLNAHRGAAQVQLVRKACSDEIFLVAYSHRDHACRFHQIRALTDKERQIGVVADAGEDADQSGITRRVAARVFERLPRDLEKHPVLRIGRLGLFRSHGKKRAVEPLRSFHKPASCDVTRNGAR